ncbi:hypothetical protein [Vallitalea sp.]|uniref:hypothetical protein n=1 Tax=Vallitalea sp. TaxID=1882829 RepID=UPI0025E971CB|nr:hypothetical protein [Vallitalea sp.]MCT4687129.1 hypothetical protein [Vallitalea sp.]
MMPIKDQSKLTFFIELTTSDFSPEQVDILDTSYLSQQQLKEIEDLDKIQDLEGYERFEILVYKLKYSGISTKEVIEDPGSGGHGISTYIYTVPYIKKTEPDTSHGIKTIVSAAYNLVLGSKTKYAGKLLKLLVPISLFCNNFQGGDYALQLDKKWYIYTVYEGVPEWNPEKQDLLKTIKVKQEIQDIVVSVDINQRPIKYLLFSTLL